MNDRRRTLLVRLSDIPLQVRLRAARHCAQNEPHPDAKAELLAAALCPRPEHDLHWVSADALELLRELRVAA